MKSPKETVRGVYSRPADDVITDAFEAGRKKVDSGFLVQNIDGDSFDPGKYVYESAKDYLTELKKKEG